MTSSGRYMARKCCDMGRVCGSVDVYDDELTI